MMMSFTQESKYFNGKVQGHINIKVKETECLRKYLDNTKTQIFPFHP